MSATLASNPATIPCPRLLPGLLTRCPVIWLLLASLIVLGSDCYQGKLRVDGNYPDAVGYLELSEQILFTPAALSDKRTNGYPLFLKLVRFCFSPDMSALPYWQFTMSVLAVASLFAGLRGFGFAPLWANLIAISVLVNISTLDFYSAVLTDSLGLSAAIGSLGFLLCLLAAGREASFRKRLALWLAVGLSVMAAYQIRPSYQILVPLVPLLGVLLLPVVASRKQWWRRTWRTGTGLAALTAVPFLAFCSLRLLLVGDFNLVSFGGLALSGISGQFVTAEMVPRLPADLQPLASGIIERRAVSFLQTRQGKQVWTTPIAGGKIDIHKFNVFFNPIAWDVVTSVSEELYGADWVRANRDLTRLALHVFQAHRQLMPTYYRLQARRVHAYSRQTYYGSPVQRVAGGVVIAAWVISFLGSLWRKGQGRSNSATNSRLSAQLKMYLENRLSWSSLRFVYAGLVVPGLFFGFSSLMILLTQAPLFRTVSPGVVLWPWAMLAVAAWVSWPGKESHRPGEMPLPATAEPAAPLRQAA